MIRGIFFDLCGEVGVKKPDPNIFKPALSSTGLTPSEVAYVGDTDEDVEAVNAAGMMPILIKRRDKDTDENYLDSENDSQNGTKTSNSQPRNQCKTISSLREILCV